MVRGRQGRKHTDTAGRVRAARYKGLYARARNGELPHLRGARTEYETLASPDVIAPNGCSEDAVRVVVQCIERATESAPGA